MRPMLELLLDLSPAVVSFHFGLPEGETIQRLRRQGIVTLATAASLQEALLIEQQGSTWWSLRAMRRAGTGDLCSAGA